MAGRTSRKRTAPARLREEMWYLVMYEDDNNIRVLAEDEISHIFPDEDAEDEVQPGDIVSAIWLPNGQYYDAKVLQKGNDKTELMRERMRLEKVNKSGENTTEGQKKRKNQKNGEGQKKKKLETGTQAESDREMEKKAKEKEEKRKKKEDEQRRKDFLLQARKAQVAERWSSTCSDTATFRPEPLHRASQITPAPRAPASRPRPDQAIIPASTPAQAQPTTQAQPRTPASRTTPPSHTTQAQPRTPASCQTQAWPRTPASASRPTPPSHTRQALPRTPAPSPTPDQATTPASQTAKQPARRRQETTPRTSVQTKRASDSRRGIHFQNAVGDSSEDEVSEESDEDCVRGVADEGGNCCREHKLENEALRKRLEKLHRRLNIALKAKAVGEIIKNRPPGGVLDTALATEYKMVEVMEGSGVYWYSHQRAYCSAFKSWQSYINAAVDMFFNKDTLAACCAMGNGKKSNGHQPLNPVIIQALIGKVCSKFSKEGPTPSDVVQKINMKCVEARRPPRRRQTNTTTTNNNE